jgi:hypothetical protein
VPYLAPERELRAYDARVDAWAMGLVLFQLAYGYHPWNAVRNPWRRGHERFRDEFNALYDAVVVKLEGDVGASSRVAGVVLEMLRHPWAERNNKDRISIQEALGHACWAGQDEPSAKKVRQR